MQQRHANGAPGHTELGQFSENPAAATVVPHGCVAGPQSAGPRASRCLKCIFVSIRV